MNAKRTAAPDPIGAVSLSVWDGLFSLEQTRIIIDGWSDAIEWIDAWARGGDWILVDGRMHPGICERISPNSWHVLWYESAAAGDVWAMLAELRGRPETQRILVVRQIADPADLGSAETRTLSAQCSDYDATLLLVRELG
jgi:hypothetical protein